MAEPVPYSSELLTQAFTPKLGPREESLKEMHDLSLDTARVTTGLEREAGQCSK